jgi:hypothetical protein
LQFPGVVSVQVVEPAATVRMGAPSIRSGVAAAPLFRLVCAANLRFLPDRSVSGRRIPAHAVQQQLEEAVGELVGVRTRP